MRRVAVRTLVLSAVLISGAIAIAYAQRGMKEEAQAAQLPGGSLSDPTAVNPAEAPQLLPAGKSANPLRTAGKSPGDIVRVSASDEDSGTNPVRPALAPATGGRVIVGGEEKSRRETEKAIDPFARSIGPQAKNPTRTVAAEGEDLEAPRTLNLAANLPVPAKADTKREAPTLAPRRPADESRKSLTANADATVEPADDLPGSLRSGLARGSSGIRDELPAAGTSTRTTTNRLRSPSEPASLRPVESKAVASSGDRPTTSGVSASRSNESAFAATSGAGRSSRMEEIKSRSAEPSALDAARNEPNRIGEGSGKPGGRQLEGPQSPQVTIQKTAPPEVQVGKAAGFQIRLKNTGPVVAQNVVLRDEIPKGTRLVSTSPPASRGVSGELVWSLGNLETGKEVAVDIQLLPVDEGEIGSVATVSFNADVSAKTFATRPQLAIKSSAPAKVLIGDDVPLSITISNPGTGIAQNVILEEIVPPGLRHAAGAKLENPIGDLKPNESRTVELKLTAAQAGQVINVLNARADANLRAEDKLTIDVLAPQLQVAMEGPKRRYLEREATYIVSVSNPGTAPARQVELIAQLPQGLKFVSANNAGQYEEGTRTVHWLLEELPTKETGMVELTTVPVEAGEQTLRVRGTAEKGLAAEKEQPVLIEGIAAIMFEVVDAQDPIEVNGETTYDIKVVNQGSKAANNVRVSVEVPTGLKPVAAEGPNVRNTIQSGGIVFEPLASLAPKANAAYRVRVQGVKAGDQRIRVRLVTDEIREPITKEESTRVYSDE